jgi:beta-galactosidase
MKPDFSKFLLLVFAYIFICAFNFSKSYAEENPRQKILFDFDWKFYRGDADNAQITDYNDSAWRTLDLPHDWSIEDIPGTNSPFDSAAIWAIDGGYLTGGTGWYRKTFEVPENVAGKKLSFYFEGIYMNADVWLNGTHLGNHPYGYTAFEYDISELVKPAEKNVLAVQVKNEGRNSRWYSGSGIYRHVWLKVAEPVHVKTWGTFITTPEISKEMATINIQTQLMNETTENLTVQIETKILDSKKKNVATNKISQTINTEAEISVNQIIEIKLPELWSTENPNLYTAIIEISDEKGKMLDKVEETFGIRSIEFSVEKGFLLNGIPTLLKGGCMHHDNGPLGAAAYNRAEERRVELMKASGFNAIRSSHNPPSEAFLDACDRLGMLVIDETFDMWRKQKNPQDYHLYFDEWWQSDVDAMVLRDRNHPSIIMWSIGNEIQERGEPEGFKTAKMLADYVRSLDPTRPVTSAVNGLGPDKDPYFAKLDISGYNYSAGGDHGQKSIFEKDHERVPDRIMYCAESYPLEAYGAWMDAVKYPYVLGDFVWTGFDYLGEASIGWRGYPHDENYYPWNHAFCGDIDICGWKRPQSFYRDVLWEVGDQLSIFVTPPKPSFPVKENRASWSKWHWHDHVAEWNWEGYENQPIVVNVYTGYKKVELFLNGNSLGQKTINADDYLVAWWEVPYQSGELKVVGYEGDSIKATQLLQTAKPPVQLKLTADRSEIQASGQDLSFITVEVLDENGFRNPKSENLVNFEISGPGKIVAVASSNPMSAESYQQPQRKAWKGRCQVIVKSEKNAGEIILKAKSEGLPDSQIAIQSK